MRALILKLAHHPSVERFVRGSRLFRGLVRRFIAGDDLQTALRVSEELAQRGLLVTLDNLGENTTTVEEAQAAKETYIAMLRAIAQSPAAESTNISIKLTQCGLDLDVDLAKRVLEEVLDVAAEHRNFVRVDMESSAYVDRTLDIMEAVFSQRKNTGTVLQSYLRRTPQDLERLLRLGMRIRLVKGAYLEPPEIAFPRKSDVDRAYVEQTERLLKSGLYHAIATHDERIIRHAQEFAHREGIPKDAFEFQMLYGIRRDLQESLAADGYRVRVYVPFGDRWYPYFTRRLAERPANVLFILKAIFRG
ncbi:MAG: proline dehydrogenase family protein [Fimbriimonadales bacterium]|nr:proline dehydrogenase family protein [Fimbriimonadales bacterium]